MRQKRRQGKMTMASFYLEWAGYKITVYAGGVKEGLRFKYHLEVGGVRVLIRHKTTKNYQSIRVRFGAELFMVNSAPANWRHILEFFDAIGFVLTEDCVSRVDFQVTSNCLTVEDFNFLADNDYVVTKLRKVKVIGDGLGSKKKVESVTLGTGSSPAQFCFYDKWGQLHSGGNFGTQKHVLMLGKMDDGWVNSDEPVTRVEIRVKRDGLKATGINSVDDLFGNEWAIINLMTQDWLRILNEPKIDGKEYKQKNHPVWDKIRSLFRIHFPGGNDNDKAEWNPPDRVSGNPEALEKQALGCLSKSMALRYGVQPHSNSSVQLVKDWAFDNRREFHYKLNTTARHTQNQSGIPLGQPPAVVTVLDGVTDDWRELVGATGRERWDDFMEKTKQFHVRLE
jgi:hypothetical protein